MGDGSVSQDEIGFGGYKIFQNRNGFRYGVDAVLLGWYAAEIVRKHNVRQAVDLCTGTGIVPMILCHKTEIGQIKAIEVQKKSYDLLRANIKENSLEDKISPLNLDIIDIANGEYKITGKAELVTINPPYSKRGSGLSCKNEEIQIARQETTADLSDFVEAARNILKDKGILAMIHRPERLVDIFSLGRAKGLEPKELVMIAPRPGEIATMVMVKLVKGGGHELKVLPEIAIYKQDGRYSDFINQIYERA